MTGACACPFVMAGWGLRWVQQHLNGCLSGVTQYWEDMCLTSLLIRMSNACLRLCHLHLCHVHPADLGGHTSDRRSAFGALA